MSGLITLAEIRKMTGSELRLAFYTNYYRNLGYAEADAKGRAYDEFLASSRKRELVRETFGFLITLAVWGATICGVSYYLGSAL